MDVTNAPPAASVQETTCCIVGGGPAGGGRHQRAEGAPRGGGRALPGGADGRFPRLRRLAGSEPARSAPPMDVLWLRLPRRPGDDQLELTGTLNIGGGHFAILFD